MGSTIEYEIGHYYKRVYGKHCWVVFRMISFTPSRNFIKVRTLKEKGFIAASDQISCLRNKDSKGWKTVELNENELVWEVL